MAFLESEVDLAAFEGVLYRPGEERLSWTDCTSPENPTPYSVEFKLNADSSLDGSSIRLGGDLDSLHPATVAARRAVAGFWEQYRKLMAKIPGAGIRNGAACDDWMALALPGGALLVRESGNMDNVFGFRYRRVVLQEPWCLYRP